MITASDVGSWITAIGAGVLLVTAAPRLAGAQTWTPREISGGYVYLNDSDNQIGLPAGWMAGGSWRLTDWLSAVGEGGISARTTTTFGSELRVRVGTVLGGARASASLGPFREFGQVLTGAVLSSGTGFGVTSTDTAFGVQPGAGLDYPVTARVAARAEVDVRFIRSRSSGSTPAHELRLLLGLVLKLT
jgi:opacity protein-like surface antigen